MTFAALNTGPAISAYWWVEIEGLRKRYGTYLPSWNPADSGTNQHIEQLLVEPPRIGEQRVDPLNGKAETSTHSFTVLDTYDQITDLLSSASVGDKAFLTSEIAADSCLQITVDDYSDLPSAGHLYLDRETFYYTTKDAAKTDTGVATVSSGSQTPTGGSTVALTSAYLTHDNGYWESAICVFTSGTNNGERREVFRSVGNNPLPGTESEWAGDVADTETPNCLYFDPNDPLPAAVTSSDTFQLTQAKRRVRCTALAGATDAYWTGAVLTVTADPVNAINVGESRSVISFNATTKVLTLNEPLPAPLDFASPGGGAATISIVKNSLSGISRGLYGSQQEKHSINDSRGDYTPVEITTRPMFIKNRRVWIYENRVGALESDAKRRQGILSDVALGPGMVEYEFNVDSMQRLLAKKLLQNPWRGTVGNKVWGGNVAVPDTTSVFLAGIIPATSDGDTSAVDTWKIHAKSIEAPRQRGSIRIGNELIHYRSRVYAQTLLRGGGYHELRMGEVDDSRELRHIWSYGTWQTVNQQGYVSFEIENWCVHSRGLLSRQCGKTSIAKWAGGNPDSDKWRSERYQVLIPEFIEEHGPGDEIRDAIYCDDSSMSDFARIDLLVFGAGSVSATPHTGDVIVGDYSGATGIVNRAYEDGTNCRVWLRRDDSDSDTLVDFIKDESITCSTGLGWTGDLASFTPGDGKRGPARNNPINVLLAMLLSGGVDTKSYGYLPEGFGLGLAEDDVDIAGIESLRDRFFSSARIDFAITEPTDFTEWSEQLCRSLAIFPFETTDGKISLGYLATEAECTDADDGSLLSIGDDIITANVAPDWTSGRAPITKVTVKYNKNPCSDDWYGKLEINFARARGTSHDFGRSEEIECASLYVANKQLEQADPRSPELPDMIARLINPLWGRHTTFPAPVVRVAVPYSYDAQIEIGDFVKLTHDLLPNLRTGARGFADEYFQVIAKEPSTREGICVLELWQVGVHDAKYGRSAPSAFVTGYSANTPSAGKSRVYVSNQVYGKQEYDPDAAHFLVGDEICFLTASGDTLGSPVEVATVEAVVSSPPGVTHYLQFDQNLTTPPSSGNIVSLPQYDSASATRRSKNAFLSGEDNTLGAAGNASFRFH